MRRYVIIFAVYLTVGTLRSEGMNKLCQKSTYVT